MYGQSVRNDAKALGMESRKIQDFQITASSEIDADHRASNGRLNFRAGGGRKGAWCSGINDVNQWFQVDFQQETIVSEIHTQGRQDADQWVTIYTISYSNDGKIFQPYTQNGQLKVFLANADRDSIVRGLVSPAVAARFIRIHPMNWCDHIAMRIEFYGYYPTARNDPVTLGMENRNIQDFQITASSEFDADHRAPNGRLNFRTGGGRKGAWCSRHNDGNQWLQVDFQQETVVNEIYTQGRQDVEQWVTSYTISYSNDGKIFQPYTQNGQLKVFIGNADRDSIVREHVSPAIVARFIRVHPKTWHGHIAMRVEFCGCDTRGRNNPMVLGMENLKIQDFQVTASSEYDCNHRASNGRLNFKAIGGRAGGWCSVHNDGNQWLQVDFQQETVVSEIYTQGRQDVDQWVTSYTISYGNDGKIFQPYTQNGQLKVFLGNADRETIVRALLSPAIVARFIRVHPKSWHGHIAMRVEFCGSDTRDWSANQDVLLIYC